MIHEPPEFRRFLSFLRNTRHVSENPLQRYRLWCLRFFGFVNHNGRTPWTATYDDASEFVCQIKAEKKPATVGHAISTLRCFYDWACSERLIGYNPFSLIRRPNPGFRVPRVLTREDMQALLTAIPGDSPQAIRDRAVLETLYSTGVRVSELCGLDLKDIDLSRRRAIVWGKGQKERVVFLTEAAAAAIRDYVLLARPALLDGRRLGALFIGRRGRIHRTTVTGIIRRAARLAGIHKHITPHTFRHTFATHILENDVDIRCVQELLGHERLSTTQIYTHVAKSRLEAVFRRAHPRERELGSPGQAISRK